MRTLLAGGPEAQAKIGNDILGETKSDIVRYLANHASAMLLDPVCAVPQVIDDGVLARDVGLDASGFDVDAAGIRLSRLAPGITARYVRALGGMAGKIMVYLRPDRPEADEHNIAILKQCIADFEAEDLLLVVEFLTYELPGEGKADYKAKLPDLITGGTRIALELDAKVLKLPYPGTAAAFDPDLFVLGGGLGIAAAQAIRRTEGGSPWFDYDIAAAALGDDAGVIGAVLAALDAE